MDYQLKQLLVKLQEEKIPYFFSTGEDKGCPFIRLEAPNKEWDYIFIENKDNKKYPGIVCMPNNEKISIENAFDKIKENYHKKYY